MGLPAWFCKASRRPLEALSWRALALSGLMSAAAADMSQQSDQGRSEERGASGGDEGVCHVYDDGACN